MSKRRRPPTDDSQFYASLFGNDHFTDSGDPTPLEVWDFMITLAQEGTEECAKLIAWRDALRFHCEENMIRSYIDQVGRHENKYQLSLLRLDEVDKKLDLVRQQIERGEPVFLSKIESEIDQDLNGQKKHIQKREELIKSLDEELLKGDTGRNIHDEIMEPYTAVICSLHPDLNPDQSIEQFLAFNKAQNAFENGEAETVQLILNNYPPPDRLPCFWDPHLLQQRINELLELNDKLDIELDKLMSKFPFNKFDLLENEEAIEWLVCDLQKKDQEVQAEIAQKEQELQQLLKNNPWVI